MNSKLCTLRDDLELHQHLMDVGLRAAAYRLPMQDWDDCGIEFYLYMRHKRQSLLEQYHEGKLPEIWLFRCAIHFAQNYARHLRYVQNHESNWLMLTEEAAEDTGKVSSNQPAPDILLCRREFKRRFSLLVNELTARQVRYLILHCVEGQSYVQIAADHADDKDAVRMTVNRARRHLHSLCVKAGFDQAEANDYLRELASPPPAHKTLQKRDKIKNIFALPVRFCRLQVCI